MFKIKTSISLAIAITFTLAALATAGETKMYRASGVFTRVDSNVVVLRTSAQDIELIRDANTKVTGQMTKGAHANIMYDKIGGSPHATEITVNKSPSGGGKY